MICPINILVLLAGSIFICACSERLPSNFENPDDIDKEERLQAAIDSIRQEFGFTTIQKATALQEASRSLARSKLIGGHSAGGLDGLK